MRVLAAAAVALVATGCSDSFDRSVCQPVSAEVLSGIASRLSVDGGGTLRNGFAVPAARGGWHFVSADLEGPGLESESDIATWAVSDLISPRGMIYAVPQQATAFSQWPDASTSQLAASSATPEVQTSQQCVRTAP